MLIIRPNCHEYQAQLFPSYQILDLREHCRVQVALEWSYMYLYSSLRSKKNFPAITKKTAHKDYVAH